MDAFAAKANTKTWYLIQCKPRQDERAEENLLRQGYELYRPKLPSNKLANRSKKLVVDSLFPGYIFIRLGVLDSWLPLRSTRGVTKVVRFGEFPLAVSDSLIDQLKRHESAPEKLPSFSAGEKVRIKDGPFAELEAIFLAGDGNERVILLLNFLHRQQQVNMRRSAITKA